MDTTKFGVHSEEIAKIIDDFLPEKIFDAHMHILHTPYTDSLGTAAGYREDIRQFFGDREVACNLIVSPKEILKNADERRKSVDFLASQLDKFPSDIGAPVVLPGDTVEDIDKQLIHPRMRGLKCYYIYSQSTDGIQSDIKDYLPESAFEVANKKGLFITLHLVKDTALADKENREYLKRMAKKYPNATIVLAHCARAFAAWTAFDTVDELAGYENIIYDFSAICESPAMVYIIKKIGLSRCMWGSDYPVSKFIGKAISIADTMYWIGEEDLKRFFGGNDTHTWCLGLEAIMASRQMSKLLDLSRKDIEDYFYNNAKKLLCGGVK